MLNEYEKNDLKKYEESVTKHFKKKLRENRNPIFVINLSSDVHKMTDTLISSVKKKGVRFGCENGCSHCCNLRVESFAPEIFYIAKQLKSKMKSSELDILISKLTDYSDKAKNLKADQHFLPCIFLDNGKCSIYNFRPATCRKYNSLDAEICKEPFGSVPESSEIFLKGQLLFRSFMYSVAQRKMRADTHELGQCLLIALTDSSAEKRWSSGERVFPLLPEAI